MRFSPAFAAVLATAAIARADALPIGEQVARCWNLPAAYVAADGSLPRIDFDVWLDADGDVLDIAVIDRSLDQKLVLSASRAIELCSPYAGASAGKTRVVVGYPPAKPPIDPFK